MQREGGQQAHEEDSSKKKKKVLSLSHILKHRRVCANVSESDDSGISPVNEETTTVVGNVVASVNERTENQLYCSCCCKNVTDMNFLIRMKHVKQCSESFGGAEMNSTDKENGRPSCVSEDSALRYWLKYNGFNEELFDAMKSRGILLKDIGRMDAEKAVEVIGMKKQKKKMMIAMEQYRQKGCIPLSKSKLNRSTLKKSRSGLGGSLKDRFKRLRGDVDEKSVESRTNALVCSRDTVSGARSMDAGYCRHKKDMLLASGIARQRQIELALCGSVCGVVQTGMKYCKSQDCDNRDMTRRLESKYVICGKENSIFLATTTCRKTDRETLTLEQRLEKRQGGAGVSDQRARCNSGDASNSVSIKRVRLKALEDELVVQKATVCHLEELIRDLKREIESDSLA